MKHFNLLLSVVFLLAVIGFVLSLSIRKAEAPHACTTDALVCPDGTSVGRTGPNCTFAPCPTTTSSSASEQNAALKKDLIIVDTPAPQEIIHSPVTITGKARGTWYFEASFPVVIVDWDGKIIGQGHAEAQSDWMTQDFVPFVATVDFALATDTPYHRGAIILKKDNPSGLPQNDNALEVPVNF